MYSYGSGPRAKTSHGKEMNKRKCWFDSWGGGLFGVCNCGSSGIEQFNFNDARVEREKISWLAVQVLEIGRL